MCHLVLCFASVQHGKEHEDKKMEGGSESLTDVQDSLFGRVLPGVPVLPVFKLLVSVLILTEHHHDHTLRRETRQKTKR